MTDLEISRAIHLGQCRFLSGSTDKAAVKKYAYWATMNALHPLTPAQSAHIERMCWKYRRQMPAHLVPTADPAKKATKAKR